MKKNFTRMHLNFACCATGSTCCNMTRTTVTGVVGKQSLRAQGERFAQHVVSQPAASQHAASSHEAQPQGNVQLTAQSGDSESWQVFCGHDDVPRLETYPKLNTVTWYVTPCKRRPPGKSRIQMQSRKRCKITSAS